MEPLLRIPLLRQEPLSSSKTFLSLLVDPVDVEPKELRREPPEEDDDVEERRDLAGLPLDELPIDVRFPDLVFTMMFFFCAFYRNL